MLLDQSRSRLNPVLTANAAEAVVHPRKASDMREAARLRELAAWYRDISERAGNPRIWESRVQMADELDTGRILTLDHDFVIYRWRRSRAFDRLLAARR